MDVLVLLPALPLAPNVATGMAWPIKAINIPLRLAQSHLGDALPGSRFQYLQHLSLSPSCLSEQHSVI